MGQKTTGIYGAGNVWEVDKWYDHKRIRQRGFASYEEAEGWLIKRLAQKRTVVLHGERAVRTFDEVAAHYLLTNQTKPSLLTEASLLKGVMPYIGHLALPQVHDSSLAPFITARLAAGRKHKTINLALGTVRHILNLAATLWRDEAGKTWLEQAPTLTMLPLVGYQREPMPISWEQQRRLLPKLADHLARMALFVLNSGVRDDVVCSLRWEWEIRVPQLGISVFEVPRRHVKGRQRSRIVVCNSVAQSVIEAVRGQHREFVFVYRRERVKNHDQRPTMAYHPMETMNNTGWQNARAEARLGDLHVHDLRHTVGMRLREAGVPDGTISDVLWHSNPSMTAHYSVAQIVELHGALEKIKADNGSWNKSLHSLKAEQEATRREFTPPKVPTERKIA